MIYKCHSQNNARWSINGIAGRAYLLLDGARFDCVHTVLREIPDTPLYVSLYQGTFYQKSLSVSPCLAEAAHDSALLNWYFSQGAQNGQALLVASQVTLEELAAHFRQYLEAHLPNKQVVVFRFYDPSIFHIVATHPDNPASSELLRPLDLALWQYQGTYWRFSPGRF